MGCGAFCARFAAGLALRTESVVGAQLASPSTAKYETPLLQNTSGRNRAIESSATGRRRRKGLWSMEA